MTRISRYLANFRSNLYYSQPVYVPGYEYSPWKTWGLLLFILSLIALSTFFLLNQKDSVSNSDKNRSINNSSQTTPSLDNSQVAPVTPSEEQPAADNATYYEISRVVDGDTIEVTIDGSKKKVRLIGVDTPETVDPRKTVQCFGSEASSYVKNLLDGKKVALETDSTQGDVDRYNRLLRYVFLPDGIDVGKQIISEGYGHEYTFNLPYKYQSQYKQAQKQAQGRSAGLWSSQTCNGNTT